MKDLKEQKAESANKSKFLPSNNLGTRIKDLSYPRFLGSIHLRKEEMNPMYNQVKNLIANDNELKLNKALKNTLFNPVTKILIILAALFNVIWVLSSYIF